MPRYGSISLVAYQDADPNKIFVKVPNEPGRWMRTELCVIIVECPQCKAHKGELCKSHTGRYWADVHYVRKTAARDLTRFATPEEKREMRIQYLEESDFDG